MKKICGFEKAPSMWSMKHLLEHIKDGEQAEDDGIWLPARPIGYFSLRERFRIAWEVFTGRADAFTWPGGQ